MTTVDPNLAMHLSETAVSVELETPDMTLNIGPQHPSTHGVLRLVARVDGERIESVDPVVGYMHRGYEKLSEVRTYAQIIALVNRIDWVSGFANEIPFVVGVEKLMGLEVPERAQYVRLILTEMARISSHLVFMSSFPLELGASTPLMHALRERERVLELIESVTGGRFHPNFNRIGGVKPAAGGGPTQKKVAQDIPKGFLAQTQEAMDRVLVICDDLDRLVTGNELIKARTVGVGVIPADKAIEFGVSGPNLRASGVEFDLRKAEAILPYDGIDFDIPTGTNGDSYDRYIMRNEEIRQAARIIKQAIDKMPSGPLQAKVPRIIKVPKGEVYVRAENPKGEMGYHI
ncbi:MAG: NADH-quinone oxidoreductase subunit D, partial [Acidimicrobiia bacterium]|nr:NADH-quinone oxidoreductase subunit D [Acidimicrobiia bacterium]